MAGLTHAEREQMIELLVKSLPKCDRGKREVIERAAREILDDLQVEHLLELINEVKREWQ